MGDPAPFHVNKDGIVYQLRAESEGGFTITVPALPGCFSFGEAIDEALVMVQEAMELWVEVAHERGIPVPAEFDLKRAS